MRLTAPWMIALTRWVEKSPSATGSETPFHAYLPPMVRCGPVIQVAPPPISVRVPDQKSPTDPCSAPEKVRLSLVRMLAVRRRKR